jgi:bifunctional non-homologous end joining protein LigD
MGGKAARERRQNWLLVRARRGGRYSSDAVVANNPLSVETGRSLDMIANDRDRVWDSQGGEVRGEQPSKSIPKRRAARIPGAQKGPMPADLKPQLATSVAVAPQGPEWLHEIKYDGYRLFARIEHGKVRLITRNGLDWTAKFPALARTFEQLPLATGLIDGELVCLASDGTTSFSDLQDAIANGKTGALHFFAFDLIYCDGWDLTGASLERPQAGAG